MAQGNVAVLTKSFVAGASIAQYQPVTATGAAATAKGNAVGFATISAASGVLVPVVVLGTALAVAGGAIAAGAAVEVATDVTRVQTRTDGVVVGRALSAAAAAGDVIEVLVLAN